MEFNLEEIKELHKNRKWISWEEEGYLISCVEKLEASNKKLREAINRVIGEHCDCNVCTTLRKAREE